MNLFKPKCLVFLLSFIAFQFTTEAQNIVNKKDIRFILDGSSSQLIRLESDSNSSSFAILIRDSVKAHYHTKHTESIMVLEGTANMKIGDKTFQIQEGDFFVIPPNTKHSVIVTSDIPLKVISVQAPEFLGEDRIWIDQ